MPAIVNLLRAGKAGVAAALLLGAALPLGAAPADYAPALAASTRSDASRQLDAERSPAQILDFARIHSGQTVADWGAGGGYYSELFASVVGPTGRVIAVGNPKYSKKEVWDALVAAHPNITPMIVPAEQQVFAPASLDVIFAHLEFHDLYLPAEQGGTVPARDVDATLRNWFAAVKPGGTVTIVDHVGLPGVPAVVAGTLHRIDPARVKADMARAGFVLDAESAVLHRSDDPHTAIVFDPGVRGKTDRFALRFRRPA